MENKGDEEKKSDTKKGGKKKAEDAKEVEKVVKKIENKATQRLN